MIRLNKKTLSQKHVNARNPANGIRFAVVGILAFFLFPAVLNAQTDTDGVLDKARKKYDALLNNQETSSGAQTNSGDANNAAQAGAADSDSASGTPSGDGTGSSTASASTSVSNGDVTVGVDVKVTVNKKRGAADQPEQSKDDSDGSKSREFALFAFDGFWGDDFSNTDVAFAFGLIGSRVGGVRGVQLGLVSAHADDVSGAQLSGVFAVTTGDVAFAQMAGVFTVANGTVNGVQMAGVFNRAGTINGAQFAGVFNNAGEVNGAQISTVNIAKKVHGVQIGLVNITDELDGIALGLVNVSKDGLNEAPFWYDQSGYSYGGLLIGSHGLFGMAYLGTKADDIGVSTDSLTGGVSAGYRFGGNGGAYFQVDGGVKAKLNMSVQLPTVDCDQTVVNFDPATFPTLRLSSGWNFWGPFSLFGGVSADFDSPGNWTLPDEYKSAWTIRAGDLTAHLSWFFGFSL